MKLNTSNRLPLVYLTKKMNIARWVMIVAGITFVNIVVALVGCVGSEITPRSVSNVPNSAKRATEALITGETEVVTAPTTSVTTEIENSVDEVPMTSRSKKLIKGGIRGRVMSKSDVATQPDSPLQAIVLTISSDKFDSFLNETGFNKNDKNNFARLGFSLSKELFEKYVNGSAASQQNGEYELKVPPGNYFLCLANLDLPTRPEMFPAYIHGCIKITVLEGEWVVQNIFTQFGLVISQ